MISNLSNQIIIRDFDSHKVLCILASCYYKQMLVNDKYIKKYLIQFMFFCLFFCLLVFFCFLEQWCSVLLSIYFPPLTVIV